MPLKKRVKRSHFRSRESLLSKANQKSQMLEDAEAEVVSVVEVVAEDELNLVDEQQHANFTEKQQEKGNLFIAHSSVYDGLKDVWIIDSGYSNHMSGRRSVFKELDESEKSKLRIGNEKAMKVEGKGIIALKTSHGNVKFLHDVQYVPCLGN
ncbi:uncharacterized protein LOC124887882 [Capsicum annuum]|uniref:uncharacterized protein LOC124887882 n=1 Tax=Capsicum annuum TaxID=4072 RepID=UPI001FB07C7F|nr:uncharacterized protein LOC124887882 [Capsicum annuum]